MAASLIEVRVPDMGNFNDVAVIDVLVKPGDSVDVDTPLVTLETEKATMDVPSTGGRRRREDARQARAARSRQGDLVATRARRTARRGGRRSASRAGRGGRCRAACSRAGAPRQRRRRRAAARARARRAAAPARQARTALAAAVPTSYRSDLAPIDEPGFSRAHAGPSVRKFARELGVDLARVTGHGFKGRITHDDVKAFVKHALAGGARAAALAGAARPALPQVPAVDFAKFGPVEIKPLSRIQKISGPRLHASWVNIPHVTQFDEADITELEAAARQAQGQGRRRRASSSRRSPSSCAPASRRCRSSRSFNASLDAERREPDPASKYLHIGFAADTPNGLVVPVIRDADRKDVYELARAARRRCRRRRAPASCTPRDMQGGCFTISSLGGIGGTAFTPIINAPEVAILGVSRSSMQPVYQDGGFVPRLMLPLSLSYDHRVIDGAHGRALHHLPRAARSPSRAPARGGAVSRVDLADPGPRRLQATSAVVDVLVKPGDIVEVDTPLVTLETDKASMDVPSTAAGDGHRGAAEARRQGLQGQR